MKYHIQTTLNGKEIDATWLKKQDNFVQFTQAENLIRQTVHDQFPNDRLMQLHPGMFVCLIKDSDNYYTFCINESS